MWACMVAWAVGFSLQCLCHLCDSDGPATWTRIAGLGEKRVQAPNNTCGLVSLFMLVERIQPSLFKWAYDCPSMMSGCFCGQVHTRQPACCWFAVGRLLSWHRPFHPSRFKLFLPRTLADSCRGPARSTALCLTEVDAWMTYMNTAEATEASKRFKDLIPTRSK